MNSTGNPSDFLPIFIQFLVAAGFVVTTMVATHVLGPKRKSKIKLETFECGIESQEEGVLQQRRTKPLTPLTEHWSRAISP